MGGCVPGQGIKKIALGSSLERFDCERRLSVAASGRQILVLETFSEQLLSRRRGHSTAAVLAENGKIIRQQHPALACTEIAASVRRAERFYRNAFFSIRTQDETGPRSCWAWRPMMKR